MPRSRAISSTDAARHAHEDAGVPVVGRDRAVLHDEEVFARSFGDLPGGIEQQGFVEAAALRVVHGAGRVDVLPAGLGPGGDRAVVELADRRDGHAHAGVGVGQYFPVGTAAIATVTGHSFVQTLSVAASKKAIGRRYATSSLLARITSRLASVSTAWV